MHNENFIFLGTTQLPNLTNSSLKYKKEKKEKKIRECYVKSVNVTKSFPLQDFSYAN